MALKVLLVGSGITAAVTGALLRRQAQNRIKLIIWDKARGSGGRMSTSRSSGDAECTADLGAQYITALPGNLEKYRNTYGDLLEAGILEPLATSAVFGMKTDQFPIGTQHYVAPNGMGSVVKHFLTQCAPDATCFQHQVAAILRKGNKLQVETLSGVKEDFDIVILTLPVPQLLQLSGDIPDLLQSQPELNNQLKAVRFSSRYALGLYFNSGDGQHEPWVAKYIENHPVFRYVALDNRKRNKPERPPAAVLHTSVKFGEENIDKTLIDMEPILMKEYELLFPDWPKPAAVKCHKWRYSQVTVPFYGKQGCVAVLLKPLVIVGGDSFSGSGFDNCLLSAHSLADQVMSALI